MPYLYSTHDTELHTAPPLQLQGVSPSEAETGTFELVAKEYGKCNNLDCLQVFLGFG